MQKEQTRFRSLARFLGSGVALLGVVFAGLAARPEAGEPPARRPLTDGGLALAGQEPDGKRLFETRCAACHQVDGSGVEGVFPPLVGSEWVTGDEGRLIRIMLQGIQGEIEVDGVGYNGVMPGWGAMMNDAEIAAVATYIRTKLNNASPVTAQAVAAVRAATSSRTSPWTVAELLEAVPAKNRAASGGRASARSR